MVYREKIDAMLQIIELECSSTRGYTGRSSLRPEVMAAMGKVLRQDFVPPALKAMAYENCPLPIGKGQTISQPFIVALMTDLLCPQKEDVILEVGAGSGYQAAILSLLVRKVYTIEIIPALAEAAAELLQKLEYENVEVQQGDGYNGWPEHAPYDGIIVTAAAAHVPPALKEQLRPGGRLVIPVGMPYMPQELQVLEKDETGVLTTRNVLPVSFVPLTRA
ncbi:MAG: protein-L-isoaspartate(D-aspartate) O-methyltransferase [Pseudomonadota bacterium]